LSHRLLRGTFFLKKLSLCALLYSRAIQLFTNENEENNDVSKDFTAAYALVLVQMKRTKQKILDIYNMLV